LPFQALVVDDEPLARQRLRFLLGRQEAFSLAAEAEDVPGAMRMLGAIAPDVVFLDVSLPGADGFRLFEEVEPARLPAVVFVTAHEQHAVRAFEVEAVDFLLKPFDEARFSATLRRVRQELERRGSRTVTERSTALVTDLEEPRYPRRLALRSAGRVTFLPVEEIDWIDAAHNYVKVHAGGQIHTCRESLGDLAAKLDPRRFVRVHRSTILNVEQVHSLELTPQGGYLAVLGNGQRLSLSRSYRDRLQAFFEPGS
jgi:two-component system LytT family response regulator